MVVVQGKCVWQWSMIFTRDWMAKKRHTIVSANLEASELSASLCSSIGAPLMYDYAGHSSDAGITRKRLNVDLLSTQSMVERIFGQL